jgi:UDP-MurNAc hydroxylase
MTAGSKFNGNGPHNGYAGQAVPSAIVTGANEMRDGMQMRLTHLGHAGFILEVGRTRILIDPWFFSGFLNSWFPYPDNRFLLDSVVSDKFDFLYISHSHEDHFDSKFLAQLHKSVAVLLPNYRSKALGKKFAAMGFRNLIPLRHQQSADLPSGIKATMLLDTSHKEDSGLLLECNGFRFLDLNDCNTSYSELPGNIDLLAAQFSGAMWYPSCYEYSPDVMAQKVGQVRSGLMKTLVRKCEMTQAKAYLPCAGPPCFLDPTLSQFNDHDSTIFSVWEDVADEFAAACPKVSVIPLQTGDSLDLPKMNIDEFKGDRPSSDLAAYSKRRNSEWGEFYASDEPEISSDDIKTYFGQLYERNMHLSKDINKYIRVSADQNTWGVHLGQMAEDFVIEGEDPYPPEYVLITSPRVLRAVLDGKTGWEEALLSLRVRLRRMPDIFDSRFMGLLRYGNEPAQTLQMTKELDRSETIEKDGLRMQRFCPHAGEDFTNATICNGVIECPRHQWKWDATNGKCIEGGMINLRIERVDSNGAPKNEGVPGKPLDTAHQPLPDNIAISK